MHGVGEWTRETEDRRFDEEEDGNEGGTNGIISGDRVIWILEFDHYRIGTFLDVVSGFGEPAKTTSCFRSDSKSHIHRHGSNSGLRSFAPCSIRDG